MADEYLGRKPQTLIVSHCTVGAKEGCATTTSPLVNVREKNVYHPGASRRMPDIGERWGEKTRKHTGGHCSRRQDGPDLSLRGAVCGI